MEELDFGGIPQVLISKTNLNGISKNSLIPFFKNYSVI
jgi:hypothetical protein